MLKSQSFPIGHPRVIRSRDFKEREIRTREDFEARGYFGFINCQVLAPLYLTLPVLPMRHEGKLLFVLCAACVEENRAGYCDHDEKERCIDGQWCTQEISLALEMGYEILHIRSVLHYDRRSSPGEIFGKYISEWFTTKKESEGWPLGVTTEEEKKAYVAEYNAAEGTHVKPERVAKNPALRQIAKLFLNSVSNYEHHY